MPAGKTQNSSSAFRPSGKRTGPGRHYETTMTDASPFLTVHGGACEVYLLRHGDATPEAGGFVTPSYDDQPLNTRGRQQAEALTRRLAEVEFAALYSSPLKRCRQTALPLVERKAIPLILVPSLREVVHSAGGQSEPDAISIDSPRGILDGGMRVGAYAMLHGSFDGLPGAEPRAQFRARVRESIDGLATAHGGQRIALFVHGGVINVYAAETLGLERDFFMPIANAAVSIIRVLNARRMLVTLNDICHLRAASEPAATNRA
jgi:probable phosphoglycerate mutase